MRLTRIVTTALAAALVASPAIAIAPASAAVTPVLAIDAGGPAVTSGGTTFAADAFFSGGKTSTARGVTGTPDPKVYETLRYGMKSYDLPIAGGTYDVTLKLVENYWNAAGKRSFDVTAEGGKVLSAVDPFALAGGRAKAVDKTFRTTVKDGTLNLGFTAVRDNASVAGIVVVPVAAAAQPGPVVSPVEKPVEKPVTTPAPAGADRASWRAPALTNPLVWVPSASQRYFSAPADRDVLVQWPAGALDVQGGFELSGGRNVVSVGGTVKFSKRYFPSMVDQPNNNRCLKITGNEKSAAPRTVHVEDFHCAGEHIWEGINVDSKGERGSLTVQFRDILVDGVHVEYPGSTGRHIGGDALQVWNGPHRLLIDGFTAKNLEYQGFFLQPYQFGSGSLGDWDIRNVNLEGAASRSAYILWLAGSRSAGASDGVKINVKNVYVQGGGGRDRSRSLWDADADWKDVISGKAPRDFVS